MNCPKCNVPLLARDRQGVEIDYCSECRGIWLDRGELDKIIEKSAFETKWFEYLDHDHVELEHHHRKNKKRRKSALYNLSTRD